MQMQVIQLQLKQRKIFNSEKMHSHVLTHIGQLLNVRTETNPVYGKQLLDLPKLENAWLLIEDDEIADFGNMATIHNDLPAIPDIQTDCGGRLVMPSWCDSHTHIVFAGSREFEMVDKIQGLTYAEINARGGGILNTVQKLKEISEDELFRISLARINEVIATGTGAIEIKSGYGLSVDLELKMLRVIRRLKQYSSIEIKSTFLGAHTFPLAFREYHEGYIREITELMLPVIAEEKLADFVDVFCEKSFFNLQETETIVRAAQEYGLRPKLHVNQLNSIGGIELGIKLNALSMDHLETMSPTDIELLGKLVNLEGASVPCCQLQHFSFCCMNFPSCQKTNRSRMRDCFGVRL